MPAKKHLGGLPEVLLAPLQHVFAKINTTPLKVSKDSESRTRMVDFSIFDSAFDRFDPTLVPGVGEGSSAGLASRSLLELVVTAFPDADRAVGAFIGNALGDSLGYPLESIPVDDAAPSASDVTRRGHLDPQRLTASGEPLYHNALNKFKLEPGQWTDAFSMALCLADTLIVRREYDGSDARVRWCCWWNHGYNNAFRFDKARATSQGSVGLGENLQEAMKAVKEFKGPGEAVPECYAPSSAKDDAGSESIMRLSPVPIMYHRQPSKAENMAVLQGRGTHPGPVAAECCRFMAFFLCRAITEGLPFENATDTPVQRFINKTVGDYLSMAQKSKSKNTQSTQEYRPSDLVRMLSAEEPQESKDCCWNWKQPRLSILQALRNRSKEEAYKEPTRFGSNSLDALAVALWGLYHTTCFEDALFAVINLGGEASTTAAVTGQLAGALYGYTGIKAGPPNRKAEPALMQKATPAGLKFSSMGECWLHHLERWDRDGEIYLRALILYCLKGPKDQKIKYRLPQHILDMMLETEEYDPSAGKDGRQVTESPFLKLTSRDSPLQHGTIRVTVVRAQGLAGIEKIQPRGMAHHASPGVPNTRTRDVVSADPYVQIHFWGDRRIAAQTKVAENTLRPLWNTSFDLPQPPPSQNRLVMKFIVRDTDAPPRENIQGVAHLTIDERVSGLYKLPLKPRSGHQEDLALMKKNGGSLGVLVVEVRSREGDQRSPSRPGWNEAYALPSEFAPDYPLFEMSPPASPLWAGSDYSAAMPPSSPLTLPASPVGGSPAPTYSTITSPTSPQLPPRTLAPAFSSPYGPTRSRPTHSHNYP